MMILISYDVNVTTAVGRKRLRKVAKICVNYGQRVQNSVFECVADAATAERMKHQLLEVIDKETDSLRIYNLGNNYHGRIEQYGKQKAYDPEGFLAL